MDLRSSLSTPIGRWPAAVLSLAALCVVPSTSAQSPDGDLFQINEATTGDQVLVDVASNDDGELLVAWQGPVVSGPGGIRGRRFDAAGQPLTGEMELVPEAVGFPGPAVAMQADGDFLVVWEESPFGVSARLFGPDGTPSGSTVEIDPEGRTPAVAVDADGKFVVAYEENYTAPFFNEIRARRLDADGIPVGATLVAGEGNRAKVAVAAEGRFVVSWVYSDPYAGGAYVQARTFDSEGNPSSVAFTLALDQVDKPLRAEIASTPDGGFVVVWSGQSYPRFDNVVEGRRYHADGRPKGGFFELDSDASIQAVASNDQDRLLTLFARGGSRLARSVSPDGQVGDQTFEISRNATSKVALAAAGRGRFLALLSSDVPVGDDESGTSIQGQRFITADLFADGFESGDTSSWSVTQP